MEDSDAELPLEQLLRLRGIFKEMSIHLLHELAEEHDVEIPLEARDIFSIMDALLDRLSLEEKKDILKEYVDAGRKATYIFISEAKNPPIEDILQKAKTLLEIEPDSKFWENYPYYDEVEVNHRTRTLRIRFHYLKGTIFTLDKSGAQREHRLRHLGVGVYRPESRILEVRAPHKTMAGKIAVRVPVHLGLNPFFSLNLMDEELIKAFVDWISSLNSATFQLSTSSHITGSIKITARRGMDLRTAERFNKELKSGRLRGGHVTIERKKGHIINFRIFFRDCHIKYTLFTSEEDIEYVMEAIEKIAEGYEFVKPDKILAQFFEKEN